MERRKILLGSGAALATALAGCSGDETSNEDDPNDTEPSDNGNGDTDDPNDDNGTEPDIDDVPGFDGSKLDLETDLVTITKIERKGDEVGVVATTEVTDLEELYPELRTMADGLEDAAVDLETFAAKIKTIEWTLEHEDKKVVSFYVDVAWLVEFVDGDLSRDQFLEKVKETAE